MADTLLETELFLEVVDIDSTFLKLGVADQVFMEFYIGFYTVNNHFIKRIAHSRERRISVAAVGYNLANQTVVVGRHSVAIVDMGINAHAIATGCMIGINSTRLRQKAYRVFCIDAALKAMAAENNIFLLKAQWPAAGNQ